MPKPDGSPTLEERIASGPKIVATGAAALDVTPNQAQARGCIFRVLCLNGHARHVSNYRLADLGLGDTPMRELMARFVCKACGGKAGRIQMLDPFRDGIDPD